jgi:hypothetical protein
MSAEGYRFKSNSYLRRWRGMKSAPVCHQLVGRHYTNEEIAALHQTYDDGGQLFLDHGKVCAVLLEVALDTFEFDIPF